MLNSVMQLALASPMVFKKPVFTAFILQDIEMFRLKILKA